MKVFARINRIGWVHLWLSRDSYEAGEPSAHFFNGKSEPRWQVARFEEGALQRLRLGDLVEIEDPGYFSDEDGIQGQDANYD